MCGQLVSATTLPACPGNGVLAGEPATVAVPDLIPAAAPAGQEYSCTPPPPPAWSDEHGRPDTDTESVPSSSHSSVLVDMGKVVGVLRSYPHQRGDQPLADQNGSVQDSASDFEFSDDNSVNKASPPPHGVCASCAQEARGREIDDSLFGDPLVYATFVAPVQQYSTETEPSRQPSVNSRQPSCNSSQPSFKQNSSEAEQVVQPEVNTYTDRFYSVTVQIVTSFITGAKCLCDHF